MDVKQGPPVTQLPGAETPPRRGRGRPRGSRTRVDAPSRASASRASLETRIGGMLLVCNSIVYLIPGAQKDALDPTEIAALAKAIDAEARQNARFRRYVEAALSAGSGGQLFGVLAIIGMRRASRHGLLPVELDGTFGALLAQSVPASPPPPPAIQRDEPQPSTTNGTS